MNPFPYSLHRPRKAVTVLKAPSRVTCDAGTFIGTSLNLPMVFGLRQEDAMCNVHYVDLTCVSDAFSRAKDGL